MKPYWIRRAILSFVAPILDFIGHLTERKHRINGRHYYELKNIVESGGVFLTRSRWRFSNLLIPGRWTHAAIYVGENHVAEAVPEGVRKMDLITFLLTKDYVSYYVPSFADQEARYKAADFAKDQLGLPYDYYFEGANKAFYCIELVLDAYEKACKTVFPGAEMFGVKTYVPEIVSTDESNWKLVWSSEK